MRTMKVFQSNYFEFNCLMTDFARFINLPPLERDSLDKKLFEIKALKEHLHVTEKLFTQYSQVGMNLTKIMDELVKSFQSFKEFESDPSLKSISELLQQNSDSLKTHYTLITEQITAPLNSFITNEIDSAVEAGKTSEICYNAYVATTEKYTSLSKKKFNAPGALEEMDNRLRDAHKQAAAADFILDRKCELVERKKLVEISASVCIFFLIECFLYDLLT